MGKKRFVTALAALALAGAGFATPAFAEETQPSLFEQIAGDYTFNSGAGGWAETLNLAADGSFAGKYFDSNADVSGWEIWICEYTGHLSNLQQVSEGIYSTEVERSACDTSKGEQYEEGSDTYTVSDSGTRFRDGDTVTIYAPGTPVADVAPEYVSFISSARGWPGASYEAPSVMPFVGFSSSSYSYWWPDNYSATPGGYAYVDISDTADSENPAATEDPAGGDSGVVAGFAADTELADLSDVEVAQVFTERLVASGGLADVPGVRIWFEDENGNFVAGMKPGDVMSDEVWHEVSQTRVKGGWHVRITSDVLPANFEAATPVKAARGEKLNVDYVVPCGEESVSILSSNNPWKSGHGVTVVFTMSDFGGEVEPSDATIAAYVRDRYETVADVPLFAWNEGSGGGYVPTYVDGCVVKAQTPEVENASVEKVQSEKLPDSGVNVGVLAGGVVTALLAGAGLLAVRRCYARV